MELILTGIGIAISLVGLITKILLDIQKRGREAVIMETRLEEKIILVSYRVNELEKKIDTIHKCVMSIKHFDL